MAKPQATATQSKPVSAPPPQSQPSSEPQQVAKATKSPAEQKRDAAVRSISFWIDKAKPAIKAALPNIGFTADRFARMAMTLVTQNPMLQECEPKTVAVGVIRSAQLGLSLDPLMGESYLIPRWNGKNKRMEASWQRGYRGVAKLIRRTGELSGIRGDVVHENDKFMRTATGDIFHEPVDGERGKRKGAYVTLYFKDGFILAHYMPLSELYAIRDRYSEGYKKFATGQASQSPWDPSNPITEKWMLIKTVLFQAAHLAPMETEAGQQLVKEAITEELPQDETMDALSAELFEGDEPIEMTRTNERLSRTEEMTKQLAGSAQNVDSNESQKQAEQLPVTDANAPPREVGQQRAELETKLVTARDHAFPKLLDGDRFIAAKTDGKFDSIAELTEKGSDDEVRAMTSAISSFVDQKLQMKG